IFVLNHNHNLNLNPVRPMKIYFDHEKLEAYKKSLAFAQWAEPKQFAGPTARGTDCVSGS
ncbi:MAG: hypothetical protein WB711_25350, partial [Terriglobales bacterium]